MSGLLTPLIFGSQFAVLAFIWSVEAPLWARVLVSFMAGFTMMVAIKTALIEEHLSELHIDREVHEELARNRHATS